MNACREATDKEIVAEVRGDMTVGDLEEEEEEEEEEEAIPSP